MIDNFKSLPPARRALAIVLLLFSLGLVTAAQRDIQQRPADEVRGSRLVWRLVCLNALGAVSYFLFGRRGTETASE